MAKRKVTKELQTPEDFDRTLREEISVTTDFDLPLSALALRIEGGWDEGTIRRALQALRVADLVCQPSPEEVLVALPNTKTRDARVVEDRLRGAVPEAVVGVAAHTRGDTAEALLDRARDATEAR